MKKGGTSNFGGGTNNFGGRNLEELGGTGRNQEELGGTGRNLFSITQGHSKPMNSADLSFLWFLKLTPF